MGAQTADLVYPVVRRYADRLMEVGQRYGLTDQQVRWCVSAIVAEAIVNGLARLDLNVLQNVVTKDQAASFLRAVQDVMNDANH